MLLHGRSSQAVGCRSARSKEHEGSEMLGARQDLGRRFSAKDSIRHSVGDGAAGCLSRKAPTKPWLNLKTCGRPRAREKRKSNSTGEGKQRVKVSRTYCCKIPRRCQTSRPRSGAERAGNNETVQQSEQRRREQGYEEQSPSLPSTKGGGEESQAAEQKCHFQESVKKARDGTQRTHERKSSAISRQRRETEMTLRRLECEATGCSFGTCSPHAKKMRS